MDRIHVKIEEQERRRREVQLEAERNRRRKEEKRQAKQEKAGKKKEEESYTSGPRPFDGAGSRKWPPDPEPPPLTPTLTRARKLLLNRLGLTSTEDNPTAIKKAYRGLALQYHPDKNPAPGAADLFKAIVNAYEGLME
jgi:hypothetical protein